MQRARIRINWSRTLTSARVKCTRSFRCVNWHKAHTHTHTVIINSTNYLKNRWENIQFKFSLFQTDIWQINSQRSELYEFRCRVVPPPTKVLISLARAHLTISMVCSPYIQKMVQIYYILMYCTCIYRAEYPPNKKWNFRAKGFSRTAFRIIAKFE